MKKVKLKILNISDLHLLHQRTPTPAIIDELDQVMSYSQFMSELDMIIISGDVFDNRVDMTQVDLHLVFNWIYRLLMKCKEYDIQLRILEGTPSHDWKQSKWFTTINEDFGIHADMLYFPALSIEHNTKHGISILYVPDEWRSRTEETYQEVLDLLKENQLDKVDFSVMHGAFEYQLPPVAKGQVPLHVERNYLDITKHFIMIGHVHKPSTFERILAPGSFSRLAHGEEEAKGYYVIEIYSDDSHHAAFHENKLATKYVTLDVGKMTEQEEVTLFIREKIKDLPKRSHIRVKAPVGHFAIASRMPYLINFPDYIWTLKADKQEQEEKNDNPILYETTVQEEVQIQQVTIDRHNVVDLVMKRVEHSVQDGELLKTVRALLEAEC